LRLLVTGIQGFVASHLVEMYRQEQPDVEVFGLDRPLPSPRPALAGVARLFEADLLDPPSVAQAVDAARPDAIVHLAAQSSPRLSWDAPAATFQANVIGFVNLLEALRHQERRPRVLVIGSSEEYGHTGADRLPLREDTPLRPTTPYAASKVAQAYAALQYTIAPGIPCICTRTFHHTGPRRAEIFAESSFARQIAEIEAGQRAPVLEVGNLDAQRDFSDVRDVVRAYALLLEKGVPGEVYNVCSGQPIAMRRILDLLLAEARTPVEVRLDPARLRVADVPVVYGDPSRLRAATGWQPRHALADSLRDLLDDWRTRLSARARAGA
jgi:GDP-4-dehydro-6-deoxy-D-mannose reductase